MTKPELEKIVNYIVDQGLLAIRENTNEKDFEELSVIQKEFQDMVNKNK